MNNASMNFEQHLTNQALAHPTTQPRDIIKQCYQAAYGAEHLLADLDRAYAYLEKEYASVTASATQPLWEAISPQICRVNLAAWKNRDLPLTWLFRMFAASASVVTDRQQATAQFLDYLGKADSMIRDGQLAISFPVEDWNDTLSSYKQTEMTAVHHSEIYRQAEHPAYRIVRQEFVRLLPVLEAVAEYFREKSPIADHISMPLSTTTSTGFSVDTASPISPCILAIDGRAASGKTTMADQLAEILGADVIRVDDFFLPPDLRTSERLQTPGGNVHYERFIEEVLPHLRSQNSFTYRRFDCHIMDYHGVREIGTNPIRIVEGSYSHHPTLGDYADLRIFSHVDPDKQMERILHRNGSQMAQMFEQRWIPMEEKYFQTYQIDDCSHIFIDSSNLF